MNNFHNSPADGSATTTAQNGNLTLNSSNQSRLLASQLMEIESSSSDNSSLDLIDRSPQPPHDWTANVSPPLTQVNLGIPTYDQNQTSATLPRAIPRATSSNTRENDTSSPTGSGSGLTIPSLAASSVSSSFSTSSSLLLNSPILTASHPNPSVATITPMSNHLSLLGEGAQVRSSSSSSSSLSPHQQLLASRSRSRSRDAESSSATLSPPVSPIIMHRARDDSKQGISTTREGVETEASSNLLTNSHKKKKKAKPRTLFQKVNHKKTKKYQQQQLQLQQQIKLENEEKHYTECLETARKARKENDDMVYLDGPRIYTCGECRTHLTSHDEIISKSFHGRHGRAYLFDACVNHTIGPPEDRRLITGMHSVCDLFCKRCKTLIGWTYSKAYEPSQKYKEGKFIIEKINLHMEESNSYDVDFPAGERHDQWRRRSMNWGSRRRSSPPPATVDSSFNLRGGRSGEASMGKDRDHRGGQIVYEYYTGRNSASTESNSTLIRGAMDTTQSSASFARGSARG